MGDIHFTEKALYSLLQEKGGDRFTSERMSVRFSGNERARRDVQGSMGRASRKQVIGGRGDIMLEKFAQMGIFAGIAWFGLRGVLPELAEIGWLKEIAPKAWTISAAVMISGASVVLVVALTKIYDRIRSRRSRLSMDDGG